MPMAQENKGFDHFIPEISPAKIYEIFVSETSDNFGRSLCNYVLKEAKTFFSSTKLQVSWKQLTRNGGQPLGKLPGLEIMRGYLPISMGFMRDQWGYSNLQHPDGVFFIQIKDSKDRLLQTIPLFVEVDTGDEDHKKNQPRRSAMKMWQATAAGHIDTSQKVKYVATLRFQTQKIDKQMHKAVKDKSSSFTIEDAIMRHNYDLACGIAEIVHGLIITAYKKNNADIVWSTDVMDVNFFRSLYEYCDEKKTKREEAHLFDYHFFIGQFEFNVFNFGSIRNMPPYPSPASASYASPKNQITEFEKKTDTQYISLFGKNKADMKQYFKMDTRSRIFKTYTDPGWSGYEKNARNLDGFWSKQQTWTCTIEHAFKKNSKPMPKQNHIFSQTYLQRVSVKRVDLREFDLKLQKHIEDVIASNTPTPIPLPPNMYYLHEIVGVLDRYITYSKGNEDILYAALNASFDTKSARVRIPESSSYEAISRQQKEHFLNHFFRYSGYHLFIEPFVNAMENVLFYLAEDMFSNDSLGTHITYTKQINDYKESVNLNKYQQPDLKTNVKIDNKSLNLGTMCLNAYHEKRSLIVKGGHDPGRITLHSELKEYLRENFKNENLEAFCQYVQCYNLHLLLELVHAYMKEENMQKKLQTCIAAFPMGVQIDIKYMIKFIYNDTTYGMQPRLLLYDKLQKHYVDDDLSKGLLKIIVKGEFHLPVTATFNLDRSAILIDGDIDYETGKWKIFADSNNSTDQFNVLKKEFDKFWIAEDGGYFNSIANDFVITINLESRLCSIKETGAFFLISSTWNVPFDIAISSTSQRDLLQNIEIHKHKLKAEYPEIKVECFNPYHLRNRFKNVEENFKKITGLVQDSFVPFYYLHCASDSNYIILYMQLFFRCAFNDHAFEHCWQVLDKYLKANRNRSYIDENDTTQDERFYREFDLFDDETPERYSNNGTTEHLKYVLPFYEIYKAIYVAKLYTYWYLKYVHQIPDSNQNLNHLRHSLKMKHRFFETQLNRLIWDRMFLIDDDKRIQFDQICSQFIPSKNDEIYSKDQVYLNEYANPTQTINQFLDHNLTNIADVRLQTMYFNIRRHGLFVSREYISVVELNSYLKSLPINEWKQNAQNVDFTKAWNTFTTEIEPIYEDTTEENTKHLPNSMTIVYDPTLQLVKTHFSIDAVNVQLTNFGMLQQELYAWSCSDKNLKIFQTILHTTFKYQKNGDDIESMEDSVSCTLNHATKNIRMIREILTYNTIIQTEQKNKILNIHKGRKEYTGITNQESFDKNKMQKFDIFKVKDISDRSTTLLLHQILNTFFLINTPNAKAAKMRLFLYRKFSCLKDRYLPYELKLSSRKNQDSPLCDDYFKDMLIGIRTYEKHQSTEVLSNSDDDYYLEELQDNKRFLLSRIDPAISNYADHKILQNDKVEAGKKNRNWFDKKVKDDKKSEIETIFFDDSVITARAIYLAWSWKWMAVRQSRVRVFASHFPEI